MTEPDPMPASTAVAEAPALPSVDGVLVRIRSRLPEFTGALQRVVIPLAAKDSQDAVIRTKGADLRDRLSPLEFELLKAQDLLTINCTYLGESLAALVFFREDHGQAHAVDGQAVSRRELPRERRSDAQSKTAARLLALEKLADVFNEAREHTLQSQHRDRTSGRVDPAAPSNETWLPRGAAIRRDRACAV